MNRIPDLEREVAALRDRLTRLSEANLRINETLDLEVVLKEILESAHSLTNARLGTITILDQAGQVEDFISSGMSPEEKQQMLDMPEELGAHLSPLRAPLRVPDFRSWARSLGIPDFAPIADVRAVLMVPIRYWEQDYGAIYLAKTGHDEEFSAEDEDVLLLFASQAALAIANARQHRAEQRNGAYLETLVNTSPVGVAVFDIRTGAPISLNHETMRIIDSLRNPEQSIEHLMETMTVQWADGRELSVTEALQTRERMRAGETVRAEEIVLKVPDRPSITMLLNVTPIRSDGGEIDSFIVTLQDLTPLEEQERLRAEFLGMVSHELRAPLSSIRGSATALLESPSELDPAEARQFHRIILDQTDYLLGLIGDLLDVAHIETCTLPIDPEPTEVTILVDRARSAFLNAVNGSRLDIDLAPDLPMVMADRRRIVQVISNLLFNAAKNSMESPVIRISALREGSQVAVSVIDDGRGILTEQLPLMFGKSSWSESKGNTGLGLAICKGLVEAHGGRIWAESEGQGLGARFTFTLPVSEYTTAGQHSPPARSQPGERNERILVVDDDPQTLRHVRIALSEAGYEPLVTADPEEALHLTQENRPNLALLDLVLRDFNGLDLMQEIFDIAEMPVIFLSAYGRDDIIARAFDMGASDYIVKPFSPTELVARVRAALRREIGHNRAEPSEPYILGDLTINYDERLVSVAGRPVRLTAREYSLLRALSLNAGQVLTHRQLLRQLWGREDYAETGSLRTVVRRLRRKLGDAADSPRYIFTESRVGYRMPKREKREEESA